MIPRCAFVVLALVLALVLIGYPGQSQALGNRQIGIGDPFPEISLSVPAGAKARQYLGLAAGESFTLSKVRTKVVLVEVLSTFCPSCLTQTELYNGLLRRLESDPRTRGQVKILGVAVANTEEQIAAFRDRYKVAFPVVTDERFTLYHALGGGQAPFSIYVLQDPEGGPGVVAGTHQGVNQEMDQLFERLKELTTMKPTALRRRAPGVEGGMVKVEPILSEEELAAKVRQAFTGLDGNVAAFRPVALESARRVFTALVDKDGTSQHLFAEVTARPSICDICHDIHFIYLFDATGRIVGFEPIHLTKYGNAEWNEADVARMRQRVLGKNLVRPLAFDPKVDAVTSATMTSAVIFDQFSQGEALMDELREQGLLK